MPERAPGRLFFNTSKPVEKSRPMQAYKHDKDGVSLLTGHWLLVTNR